MTREEVEKIIAEARKNHEVADLRGADLAEADLHGADFRGADLHGANLRWADLYGADLRDANFRRADLHGADLREADLRGVNLRWADLRGVNLRWADLYGADLAEADLRGANIDYSTWPLWCGSFDVKVDKRIAAQLAYHFCAVECDDPEVIAAQNALLPFVNQFHLVNDAVKKLKSKRRSPNENA